MSLDIKKDIALMEGWILNSGIQNIKLVEPFRLSLFSPPKK